MEPVYGFKTPVAKTHIVPVEKVATDGTVTYEDEEQPTGTYRVPTEGGEWPDVNPDVIKVKMANVQKKHDDYVVPTKPIAVPAFTVAEPPVPTNKTPDEMAKFRAAVEAYANKRNAHIKKVEVYNQKLKVHEDGKFHKARMAQIAKEFQDLLDSIP